jgi:hypothetical protein
VSPYIDRIDCPEQRKACVCPYTDFHISVTNSF